MTEIETQLVEYIRTKIVKNPKKVIEVNTPLISSGLVDSFHLVDLGVFVEDEYDVRIEDSELNAQTFDTVAQLAALIEARR
jgi:acyl carrier protein